MSSLKMEDRQRTLDGGQSAVVNRADWRRAPVPSHRLQTTPRSLAMTIARAHLIDPAVARWYQCNTRCVRRAFLLGEGATDRKLRTTIG